MAYIEKRHNNHGKVSYRARVRLSGFPAFAKTFERYAQAKCWAVTTEQDLKNGRLNSDMQSRLHTVREMIDRYLDVILPNKTQKVRYIETQKSQLNWWKSQIGDYLLNNVRAATISECRDKLSGKKFRLRKPGTVNRYLAALSCVFNVAVNEWGWLAFNPVSKVKKAREPVGRLRFLTEDEIIRLITACKEESRIPLYLIVLVALATGARKNEILTAKVENYNVETSILTVYETKNSEPRSLHITDLTKVELEKHIASMSKQGLVFCKKRQDSPINIESAWQRAKSRAGISNFRFHDLRHTAASYLAMNGASLVEIADILGHKKLEMVKRYAHLSQSHTHNVVAAMNAKIFQQEQL